MDAAASGARIAAPLVGLRPIAASELTALRDAIILTAFSKSHLTMTNDLVLGWAASCFLCQVCALFQKWCCKGG